MNTAELNHYMLRCKARRTVSKFMHKKCMCILQHGVLGMLLVCQFVHPDCYYSLIRRSLTRITLALGLRHYYLAD